MGDNPCGFAGGLIVRLLIISIILSCDKALSREINVNSPTRRRGSVELTVGGTEYAEEWERARKLITVR